MIPVLDSSTLGHPVGEDCCIQALPPVMVYRAYNPVENPGTFSEHRYKRSIGTGAADVEVGILSESCGFPGRCLMTTLTLDVCINSRLTICGNTEHYV